MAVLDGWVPHGRDGRACCQIERFNRYKPGQTRSRQNITAAPYCRGREDAEVEDDDGKPDARRPRAVEDCADESELLQFRRGAEIGHQQAMCVESEAVRDEREHYRRGESMVDKQRGQRQPVVRVNPEPGYPSRPEAEGDSEAGEEGEEDGRPYVAPRILPDTEGRCHRRLTHGLDMRVFVAARNDPEESETSG